MVFSSLNFLFLFLPALLPIYFLFALTKHRKISNFILLAFSLFFYAYGTPKFIIVMLLSIGINYIGALFVDTEKSYKKPALFITVALNLGILFYYKYTNFFVENINSIFKANIAIREIILPIGISFFTFQGMSYVIDVYKKEAKIQKNPLNVALYISLFPQLIAGPIVRYSTVAEEIETRKETLNDCSEGILRFCLGLGKKVIIANSLGLIADRILNIQPSQMSVTLTWLGAVSYAFQIYFDFSGYSDMAIGLGRVFGFHFLENFNYPYISKSITEFWRRWHISLSTWFRDYIYIPLGGNRCSALKNIRNIAVVWFLTGFWHGASWNFICWGLYFMLLLLGEKFVYGKLLDKLPNVLKHIYAIILILIGWVIFYCTSMSKIFSLIKNMFGFGSVPFINELTMYNLTEYKFEFLVALIACLPISKAISGFFDKQNSQGLKTVYAYTRVIYAFIIFLLSIVFIVDSSFNPFIYFRF